MTILFLLTALFATIAVTIAAGLAVLSVYLWRTKVGALSAAYAYQTVAAENAYLRAILNQRATADEAEAAFTNGGETVH